jgi:hypothetical protein
MDTCAYSMLGTDKQGCSAKLLAALPVVVDLLKQWGLADVARQVDTCKHMVQGVWVCVFVCELGGGGGNSSAHCLKTFTCSSSVGHIACVVVVVVGRQQLSGLPVDVDLLKQRGLADVPRQVDS